MIETLTPIDRSDIRPGDVIQGVVKSSIRNRTVRLRVDREPWAVGPNNTCVTDGRSIEALITSTLHLVDGDFETTKLHVLD